MAIPNKENQQFHRREPAYRRLTKSPALARMWSDGDLAAISPDDPMTSDVLDGAARRVAQAFKPIAERKQDARAERQARTASGQAVARLLGREQAEGTEAVDADTERINAEAEAFVAQMTPAERDAVEEAMTRRAAKAAQEAMSEGEREAAAIYQSEQAAAARVTADLGFDPDVPPAGEVWNDADIEETGLEWQEELEDGEAA